MKPEWSGANFLRREQIAEGARKVEIVRNLALHCRFLMKIGRISPRDFQGPPRAPKGPSKKFLRKAPESYIYTHGMIRNPCLFGIIANSIPIDQERSVCDILGAFLTGLRGREGRLRRLPKSVKRSVPGRSELSFEFYQVWEDSRSHETYIYTIPELF